MASNLRRVAAAAGATALIAGAVIVGAPPAVADGGYYGTWTLTTLNAFGQKVKCEGAEDPSNLCPGGQRLVLNPNYRYRASAYLAEALFAFSEGDDRKGSFVTSAFPGADGRVLVLEGGASGIAPIGSAWQMTLKGKRSGSPTKMILTLETALGFGDFALVFERNAN